MPSLFVTTNGIISGFISLFGAVGNALIIVAFLKTKPLQTVNNIFLFQLAIVDFTKAVFILTVKTYTQLTEEHYVAGLYCPFSGFLSCVTFIHSALLLAVIAIVRYVKIVKSRTFEKIFSKRRMIIYCSSLAFATTILALLPIFGVGRYDYSKPHGVCFTRWIDENLVFRSLFYVYVMGFCYPVLIFCYSFIFYSLRKHKNRVLENSKLARRRSAQKATTLVQQKREGSYRKMDSNTNLDVAIQDGADIEACKDGGTKVVKWNLTLEMETKETDDNVEVDEKAEGEEVEKNGMASGEKESGAATEESPKEKEEVEKTRKKSVPKKEKGGNSSLSRHAIRNEIRVTKVMFVVVITFSICWLPAFFTTVIEFSVGPTIPETGLFIIITLVDMKVFLNPMIYGIWNKQFRHALLALFLRGVAAVTSSTRDGDSRASHSQSNAGN